MIPGKPFDNYEGDQRTLGYILQDVASRQRDKTFAYFKEESITYGELDAKANRIANGLIQMGLGNASKVGVMLPNCLDYVLLQFGIARAGMVQVPINIEARESRLSYLLNNSDLDILIIDEQFLTAFKAIEHDIIKVSRLIMRLPGKGLPTVSFNRKFNLVPFADLFNTSVEPPKIHVKYTDMVAIFYTSGTTGLPKGVMLSHNHHWYFGSLIAQMTRMTEKDIVYCPLPYYHGLAQFMATVPALLVGGGVVLAEKFSASRFWDDIRRYNATVFKSVYTLQSILMKQPERPDDGDSPLRVVLTGGLDAAIWEAFEKRFKVKIISTYGSTEQTTLAYIPYDETRIGSAGKICPNLEVAVVDEEDNILPSGSVGEMVSRPKLPYIQMMGYYNSPEETYKATRNLWLHSGELGYIDKDGWLYFVGRATDIIRRGGEKVSAVEIESILNSHPAIAEVAATPVPSELGEDEIKADIVLKPGENPSHQELIAFCEKKMAKYMVPRYLQFRDSLPKTGAGKLQKVRLSEEGLTPDTWDRVKCDYIKNLGNTRKSG